MSKTLTVYSHQGVSNFTIFDGEKYYGFAGVLLSYHGAANLVVNHASQLLSSTKKEREEAFGPLIFEMEIEV